jgi:hypothetical protein
MASDLLLPRKMLEPCVLPSHAPTWAATESVLDVLARHLAIRCPGAISAPESAAHAAAVVAARDAWTASFDGKQFSLGRAYYTHLEEGLEADYFGGAEASDHLVRRCAPGLQERLLALASEVLGAPVTQRSGWCGPGVHIFPAGGEVARRGGVVHFDTEGLTTVQIAGRAPAVSMVLMLQKPLGGGGLRVWDHDYAGDDFPDKPGPSVPVTQIDYAVGELVVFDSYRLHQILPFRGEIDRISATMHAVCDGGAWRAWF